jgi:hypothetical protein
MPHEPNSKRINKESLLTHDVEPIIEHRLDPKKEAGRRTWTTEIKKPTVGKKSGSGRRIHSPRDNLAR